MHIDYSGDNNNDMNLLDNEIQKITNNMLYGRLAHRMACLMDETTDGLISQLLMRDMFIFPSMHSSQQQTHLARVTGIYYAMVMDRVRRLLKDALFVALLDKHYPQRKKYMEESLAHYEALRQQKQMPDWGLVHIVAPNLAMIIVTLGVKHHFACPDVARFMRLHRSIGGGGDHSTTAQDGR